MIAKFTRLYPVVIAHHFQLRLSHDTMLVAGAAK
jgi:hypothetical protein